MDEIKLKKLISDYKSSHPQVKNKTDKEIISIMCSDPKVKKEDVAQLSTLLSNQTQQIGDSCNFSKTTIKVQTKSVIVKTKEGKNYNLNKSIELRINNVFSKLTEQEKCNGFIGKAWSGFKNLTGIGDSSDNVRQLIENERKLLNAFNSNSQKRPQIFKELTGLDYTPENLEKFIKGQIKLQSEIALNQYKEGQEMAVDIGADIISGVAAVGIYTAAVAVAPFTAGASIAVGVAAAGASGALIKSGVKAADAAIGGREYSLKDFGHDCATGAVSGILAPATGGLGGAVGKTVATNVGVQAIKSTAGINIFKQAAKGTLTKALTNPLGYEYIGGTAAKRAIAISAEVATDGALGGSLDNAFRTTLDGGNVKEVIEAAGAGFVGGAILSPIVGGGMKVVGKHLGGNSLKEVMEEFPDEVEALAKMTFNGQFRFNGDDIVDLAYMMHQAPDIVKKLANIQIDGKPRFNGGDIGCLAGQMMDNPSAVEKLINMQLNGKPRFNALEINNLVDSFNKNSMLVEKLAMDMVENKPRFGDIEIATAIYAFDRHKDEKFLNQLLNAQIDGKICFNGSDIASLLETKVRDFDRIMQLAKHSIDGKPRFSGNDIRFMVESPYQNEIDEIISITIEGKPRFNSGLDISNLSHGFKKFPKETKELLEMVGENGEPRFKNSMYSVINIAEYMNKMPELTKKFINAEINGKYCHESNLLSVLKEAQEAPESALRILNLINDGYHIKNVSTLPFVIVKHSQCTKEFESIIAMSRFKNSDIDAIADIALFKKDTPEIFKKTVNEMIDGKPRFDDKELVTIGFLAKSYPDVVSKMIDTKIDGKPVYTGNTMFHVINDYKENPQLYERLINLKNADGKCLLDINNSDIQWSLKQSLQFSKEIEELFNNKNFPDYLIADMIKESNIFNYTKWLNRPIESMTKGEKQEFLSCLLAFRNCEGINKDVLKQFPAVPKTEADYIATMRQLGQSLNISFEKLSNEICTQFNSNLKNFESTLSKIDLSKLDEISLAMPHSEFIQKVEKCLSGLSQKEQLKIKEFYGFNIKNGELSGYPDNFGKDLSKSGIKNLKTAREIEKIIKEYKNNNFITVKNCPELNQVLKDLSKVMPEIFNQIDGSKTAVEMIKTAQKIIKNPNYAKLSDSDKKVLMFATLLHNTDKNFGNTTSSAFDAFFIAQKFGFSDNETKKVYSIIQSSDLIERFMNTNKEKISKDLRGELLETTNRKNTFERLAFDLKEGNNFELAQMLYSSKDKEGLTRYIDKMLEAKIKEMKSADFVLPQTSMRNIAQYATTQNLNGHNVKVINVSDLDEFYAFIHTPECGFASGNLSRNTKFANFEAFGNISDDKIICTSYISKDKICAAADHGFIFDVPNEKQFVGMGYDIFSLCKNVNDMLTEYFDKNSTLMAPKARGLKNKHRTMISDNLKQIMKISDDDYIKKVDNIKARLGNEPMTLEKLDEIDADFARAYREFLSRDNTKGVGNADALLRNDGWNEVLVGTPKISAIFTRDLKKLPKEYLIKAEKENLPIIVLQ